MSIWIIAVGLLVVIGGLGLLLGAVRTAFLLVGVWLSLMLAKVLGPLVKGLVPLVGIKTEPFMTLLPPVFAFTILVLIFLGVSFAVHHKAYLYFKYRTDDLTRLRWEKMNRFLGLPLGMIIAVMLLFSIGKIIYVWGYPLASVATEDSNPGWMKNMAQARADMRSTGFDRLIGAKDRTPQSFYQASDIMALVYHNPILQNRLFNYPALISLTEKPEFQEIITDKEYNDLIFSKGSIGGIVNHTRSQSILANQEILGYGRALDLKDLETYLKTGKSPKYDDTKILGRWSMDKDSALLAAKKRKPDMTSKELLALKKAIMAIPNVTLVATPDNKIVAKADAPPPVAAPAEGQATSEANPSGDTALAARYGLNRQPPAARPAAKPVAPKDAPLSTPVVMLAGEGTWKGDGEMYEVEVPDHKGKQVALDARIDEDEMTLSKGAIALVFIKSE